MKKLQLDLDTLAVDSFETAAPSAERGTVAAHDITNTAPTCHLCTRYGDTCGDACFTATCPRTYNC